MSVSIDTIAFKRRVGELQKALPTFGVNCLLTSLGKGDKETEDTLTLVLHIWLLGYPFANTAILLDSEHCEIVTSQKQAKHLEGLESESTKVIVRPKDVEESKKTFEESLQRFVQSDAKVGLFRDTFESPVALAWREVLDKELARNSGTQVDVSSQFETLLHIKDGEELAAIETASKAARGLMLNVFADEMTTIIDEGRKVPNEKLAKKITDTLANTKVMRKLKLGPDFENDYLDYSFQSVVKSGSFDLKTRESTPDNLKAGVIHCQIGLRYKFYSGVIARTYMIDASKEQEQNYTILVSAQKKALAAIKSGATCSEVYEAARSLVAEKNPDLVPKLSQTVGHAIGIQLEEPGLELKEGNTTELRDRETIVVSIALENIEENGQTYSLGLSDTVQVSEGEPLVYTDNPRNLSDVAFSLQAEEKAHSTRSTPRQLRVDPREKANQLLAAHQGELKKQLQERGLAKYSNKSGAIDVEEKIEFKKYESYKTEKQLPHLKDLKIALDANAQTIIVPINGRAVPFHINTYKNGSRTEEGEYVYLRLNFNSPDTALGKNEMPFENPNATFIKSLTVRSKNIERINEVFKKISDMKREAARREAEKRQLKDVVQQDKLIEIRDKRPLRLENVFVRPAPEGKRVPGIVELHKNGVRFQSPQGRDQTVDVLFSNVEQLFYQPCDKELVVIVHFHLKNPILIGKRKTTEVQFYRDATETAYDDTGNRRRKYRYGDEDEIEQEQEERRMRVALNKEFKNFAEQVSKTTNGKLTVEIPFRELGFEGVPHRSAVYLQPTTDYLVQLVDTPFLVLKLDEIEVAHFERVQYGLKEFDLVFVFKDFTKPPTHINTISVGDVDHVKDWLNSVDIPFYEGPLNLNWTVIMKTISQDPKDFFETGGWDFLSLEDENAEEEVEEESEFEISEDAPESDEYEEEEDFSAESEIETASESEGPDWDELEEEAANEDERNEERKTTTTRPKSRSSKQTRSRRR